MKADRPLCRKTYRYVGKNTDLYADRSSCYGQKYRCRQKCRYVDRNIVFKGRQNIIKAETHTVKKKMNVKNIIQSRKQVSFLL